MTPIRYVNFDLLIRRNGAQYLAEVVDSPVGQAECDFALPFALHELTGFERIALPRTRQLILRDRTTMAGPPLNAQEFGQRLFQAVFAGNLDTHLMRSLDRADAQQAGLRIRLRLDASVAELADLPWEYLYVPALARFAVLSSRIAIVRYLKLGQPEKLLKVRPPLRVLVLVADPRDAPALNVEQEWNNLQQATAPLAASQLMTLERLAEPTLAALRQRLRQGAVHVFHFIGHGFFDQRAERGGILFEQGDGQGHLISADVLATRLHDHPGLRLVYLNACEGAGAAVQNLFAGVAQRLVQQGIPAVVAMQFPVTDRAAITLAQEFYQALADGYPVDAALGEARKVVYEQDAASSEWGTPVLFMRSDDGRLFDMETDVVAATRSSAPVLLDDRQPERGEDEGHWRNYRRFLPVLGGLLGLLLVLFAWRIGFMPTPATADPEVQGVGMGAGAAPTVLPVVEPTATLTPTPTLIVFASPTPVLPAQPKVLVADFANCSPDQNFVDAIRSELDEVWSRTSGPVEFAKSHALSDAQSAIAEANASQAQVVIWGSCLERNQVQVTVRYVAEVPPPFDELLFEPQQLTLEERLDRAARFAAASILYAYAQVDLTSQVLSALVRNVEDKQPVESLWLQANSKVRREQWAEAIQIYEKALAETPPEAVEQAVLLRANLGLAQREAALSGSARSLACKADNPTLNYRLAISLTNETTLPKEQTALLAVGHALALETCNAGRDADEVNRQLFADAKVGIEYEHALGFALQGYLEALHNGDMQEASYYGCEALKRQPVLPLAHFVLGYVDQAEGKPDKARARFTLFGNLAHFQSDRNIATDYLADLESVSSSVSLITPSNSCLEEGAVQNVATAL